MTTDYARSLDLDGDPVYTSEDGYTIVRVKAALWMVNGPAIGTVRWARTLVGAKKVADNFRAGR